MCDVERVFSTASSSLVSAKAAFVSDVVQKTMSELSCREIIFETYIGFDGCNNFANWTFFASDTIPRQTQIGLNESGRLIEDQ